MDHRVNVDRMRRYVERAQEARTGDAAEEWLSSHPTVLAVRNIRRAIRQIGAARP